MMRRPTFWSSHSSMPAERDSPQRKPITLPWKRVERRSALRFWAAALAGAWIGRSLGEGQADPRRALAAAAAAADRPPMLSIDGESVQLRARFDPQAGLFGITRLVGFGTNWVPDG